MQKTSSALVHMVWEGGFTDIPVLFGDTGYHFPETLATRDALARRYPLEFITFEPEETPAQQTAREGRELWRDAEGYERCCLLRKVQPWLRAAHGYEAILSGLQRAEGGRRAHIPVIQHDPRLNAYLIYPLANWTTEQVDEYNRRHDVPVNPLHEQGFPSIGCATCTTAVNPGEDPRAGRWRHIREAGAAEGLKLYCHMNWADRKQATGT
jgi:phosphoadenosine phosphosulfate reductase